MGISGNGDKPRNGIGSSLLGLPIDSAGLLWALPYVWFDPSGQPYTEEDPLFCMERRVSLNEVADVCDLYDGDVRQTQRYLYDRGISISRATVVVALLLRETQRSRRKLVPFREATTSIVST